MTREECCSISPKPTDLTEERSLVGVLEPDVLVQGCPLDAGVVAGIALELHVLLVRVLPENVRLQLVV